MAKDEQNHLRLRRRLEAFRNAQEWSDFISLLTAVDGALAKTHTLPEDLQALLFKRLHQSLNPGLPAGVHSKALETYRLMICHVRLTDILLLGLFSYGLYAKLSVKSVFFDVLCELSSRHVDSNSFVLGLLPFLEEEGSRYYDRACDMIEHVNDTDAIWRCFLLCPDIRIAVINYFKDHTVAVSDLLVSAVSRALYEGDSYVVRGTLDMLNASVRLDDLVRHYNPGMATFEKMSVYEQARNDVVAESTSAIISDTTVRRSGERTAAPERRVRDVIIKVEDSHLQDSIVGLGVQLLTLFLRKEITLNKKISTWLRGRHLLTKRVLRRIMDSDMDMFYRLFHNLIEQEEIGDRDIAELLVEAMYRTKEECTGLDIVLALLENGFLWKVLYAEFKRVVVDHSKDGHPDKNGHDDQNGRGDHSNDQTNDQTNDQNDDQVIDHANDQADRHASDQPNVHANDQTIGQSDQNDQENDQASGADTGSELVIEEKSELDVIGTTLHGDDRQAVNGDDNEKSISLEELSRIHVVLEEKVGPDQMLALIHFLFTRTVLREQKNSVHALHVLLMLCINSTLFERARLNETIRALLGLVNMQEAMMYEINYGNLFGARVRIEDDASSDTGPALASNQKTGKETSIEVVDRMLDGKLCHFYFHGGMPAKYMALERVCLTNDTLLAVVQHFNPFDHAFWQQYIDENDLKDVYFVLRRVARDPVLERCKRRLFHRLFYEYDEKLFMAYEVVYENGFEECMIDEIRSADERANRRTSHAISDGNHNIARTVDDNNKNAINDNENKNDNSNDIDSDDSGSNNEYTNDKNNDGMANDKKGKNINIKNTKNISNTNTNNINNINTITNTNNTNNTNINNISNIKVVNDTEMRCLKILKYSFNVLNVLTFYKTLNMICCRRTTGSHIIVFLSSLSSSALFSKVLSDRNIPLIHRMLLYNHKFIKYLRKGMNIMDTLFDSAAITNYFMTDEECFYARYYEEYLLVVQIIRLLLRLGLVPPIDYVGIYTHASLLFLYDTLELIESILEDRSTHAFFLRCVPPCNIIFRVRNKEFLREYYLQVIGEYHRACLETNRIREEESGQKESDSRCTMISSAGMDDIDLVFLLDILKRIYKRRQEFNVEVITEKVIFILASVYKRQPLYRKRVVADTIYDDPEQEGVAESTDGPSLHTVMNSIFEMVIGESTFIGAYMKYFSMRLPLSDRVNKKIFLLLLRNGKYAYLNRIFNPVQPVARQLDMPVGDSQTERLAIGNVFMERLGRCETSYFGYFFDSHVANQRKVENISHLYFLMLNMDERAKSQRVIEMCLQFLQKTLQSRKIVGGNLLRVCLRCCGTPINDRNRGLVTAIACALVRRAYDSVGIEEYNGRYTDVMVPHFAHRDVSNECTSCNTPQSIGLDTIIYHHVGIKEFVEHFLDSPTFFQDTKCSLIKKGVILRRAERERIEDLFYRLSSNFFTSREADSQNKALVLRKMSFFILVNSHEAFSPYLQNIVAIINDLLDHPRPVRRELFNLISILFLRFSHVHLTSLFPIYFSTISEDTLLEGMRSLEMLMVIGSKETVEYRWHIARIFDAMRHDLYRDTCARPYLDRLPRTRTFLLGSDKQAFLSQANSYFEMLDRHVWTIDYDELASTVIGWYVQ